MKYHSLKAGHQNNVPENEIASFYLNQIKASGTKNLYFHPLGKSPSAMSNKFRLAVLQYLTACNGLYTARNNKHRLEIATQSALDAGYTIHEVPSEDYDRKLYLSDVKAEAAQFDLLQAA